MPPYAENGLERKKSLLKVDNPLALTTQRSSTHQRKTTIRRTYLKSARPGTNKNTNFHKNFLDLTPLYDQKKVKRA